MVVSSIKGSILESQLLAFVPLAVLALMARWIVPKILKAEKARTRFALGVVLLGIYTIALLVMIWHMVFGAASIEDCMIRSCVAVVMVNLMVLFVASLYFFTRDKRNVTEMDRMKLKDL